MTAFVLVFALIFTAFQGAVLAAIPTIMAPTLPLGVRVPQAHLQDPAIGKAVRGFRWGLAVAWLVAAAVAVAFALAGSAALAILIPILLNIGLGIVSLVISRRVIIHAKNDGKWFEGIPVRASGEITAQPHQHPPLIWSAIAAIVLAIAAAVLVAKYPTLPDPIPIHFRLDGTPDSWASKSIWSVFGVIMVGAAVAALLTGLSFLAARYSMQAQADDSAAQATLRTQTQRTLLTSLLCHLAFVIALGLSAISLAQFLLPSTSRVSSFATIGMVVLIMAVLLSAVARARRQLLPANTRTEPSSRPDAVDDDAHWKGGVLYVNRSDPSFLVPKRFGIGWTINLGHPAGAALSILLLLLIVGGVVAAIVGAHAR